MLNIFRETFEILAPVDGFIINIEDIPDRIFAEKIIGDGTAIRATSDIISAPLDGRIVEIFDSNHAFIIEGKTGIEVLVHIGLNTIELQGEGFERLTNIGEEIKAGEPIIKIDREKIDKVEKDLIVPIVLTNMDKVKAITYCEQKYVKSGQGVILTYKIK